MNRKSDKIKTLSNPSKSSTEHLRIKMLAFVEEMISSFSEVN